MIFWIKMACLAMIVGVVYLTPPGASGKTLGLLGLSFLPYALCVVEEYRIGREHDRNMANRFE